MTPLARAEAAVGEIAAWHGRAATLSPGAAAIMSPMHRGVSHESWVVALDGGRERYFLKVPQEDMRWWLDIGAIWDAGVKAAQTGAAPAPRFHALHAGAIAYDLLSEGWRFAYVDDLHDQDVMAATVAAKRAIHHGPAFAHTRSVFDRIEDLAHRAAAAKLRLPADHGWMLENVREIAAAVKAAGMDRVPCHGDGSATNVMLGPNGTVMLVDFDAAANADPYQDLGALFIEAYDFARHVPPALEAYAGRAEARLVNRCLLYGIADDFAWGLWAMLSFKLSPRTSVEFFKYAEWRFLRCRMNLHDSRFEERLRRL